MTFLNFPMIVTIVGLGVLAGILFVLQRLRVRHRTLPVMTTLFWHEAVEESRARVLTRRFRHPWTYALLLLIAALLWLAAAGPQTTSPSGRTYVLVLDGSAAMTQIAFERAADDLVDQARRLPESRRHVLLAGALPSTLLGPGEQLALLRKRIDNTRPDQCVSTIEPLIRTLSLTADAANTSVVIFGASAVDPALLALCPEGMSVARRQVEDAASEPLVQIARVGATPAADGAWDRVDVVVELLEPAANSSPVELMIGEKPFVEPVERTHESGRTQIVARNITADGKVLSVRAGIDSLASQNARFVLPNRPLIRVRVAWQNTAIVRALQADPAIVIVSDAADVTITSDPNVEQAIVISDRVEENDHAFLIESDQDAVSISDIVHTIGLDQIDAQSLAEQTAETISVGMQSASTRRIHIWKPLLSSQYDFTSSPSFPLLISSAVRWLASQNEPHWYARAGESPVLTGRWIDERQRVFDGAGGEFIPVGNLILTSERDPSISIATMLPVSTRVQADASDNWSAPSGFFDLITLLGLAACVLLAMEWWLVRTERIA